jgi:hypothetical protein
MDPSSPGTCLRAHAVAELRRAIACLGWRGSRAHAGVHRARAAMRRVRACLALGGDSLLPGAAMLDRELHQLLRDLSSLRDAQARVETLDWLLQKSRSGPEMDCLRRVRRIAMAERPLALRAAQAADPGFAQRQAQLGRLLATLQALAWERIGQADLDASLRHGMDDARQAAERAARGDRKDWHRWRRQIRRMRQQCSALSACGIGSNAIGAQLHPLARTLGHVIDLQILREQCGKRSPFRSEDRDRLRAMLRAELDRKRTQAIEAK